MKKNVIIHPFLFALFPVITLFANNLSKIPASHTLIPSAAILSSTLVLWLLFTGLFKEKAKAAAFISFFLLLFFSFGHICKFSRVGAVYINGHAILGAEIIILLVIGSMIKKIKNIGKLTEILNMIGLFLVLFPLGNIIFFNINMRSSSFNHKTAAAELSVINTAEKPEKLPNIFYIILDGYARQDVLKEIFQHDNSEFINFLTTKGFYVAHKSNTNYAQTILSVPSSLNLEYVNKLADKIGHENTSWGPLFFLWRNNRVFKFLKQYGYKTITFDAQGWNVYLRKQDVDIFFETPSVGVQNAFQSELLDSTPIPFILIKIFKRSDIRYSFLRKRILNTFSLLEEIAKEKGPYFVFAHLLTPHQPFLFEENGEFITPAMDRYTEWYTMADGRDRNEYIEGYRNQIFYIDRRTEQMIDKLLSNSPHPPVIILQADHGSDANLDPESVEKTDQKEKMGILNAYYFPDRNYSALYEEITPVNTFRVIFNHFFGTDFKLLEDRSYFSPWTKPYKLTDVTDRVR